MKVLPQFVFLIPTAWITSMELIEKSKEKPKNLIIYFERLLNPKFAILLTVIWSSLIKFNLSKLKKLKLENFKCIFVFYDEVIRI